MFIYRAKTNCPKCDSYNEVWVEKGKVVPLNIIECTNEDCGHVYDGCDFISGFIELRTNSSISSYSITHTPL